jgi:hydroxymethylglutaryl-CoA reductase
MNGIDAVLATGNDFRAVEAEHAYAAKSGKYTSLSCSNRRNLNFG